MHRTIHITRRPNPIQVVRYPSRDRLVTPYTLLPPFQSPICSLAILQSQQRAVHIQTLLYF